MGDSTQILRKPLILVAVDDHDQRVLIWEVLEQFGFRIVTAEDGRSAYDLFRKIQPDAIILDWMIEQLSGIEVCRRLRRASDAR